MMKDKNYQFDFVQVTSLDSVRMLLSLPTDEMAVWTIFMVKCFASDHIPTPICHIFNKCLMYDVCPMKVAKVIPMPKDNKSAFTCANSHPISILHIFNQMQDILFGINSLLVPSMHTDSFTEQQLQLLLGIYYHIIYLIQVIICH